MSLKKSKSKALKGRDTAFNPKHNVHRIQPYTFLETLCIHPGRFSFYDVRAGSQYISGQLQFPMDSQKMPISILPVEFFQIITFGFNPL